jgi:hypothetical protein
LPEISDQILLPFGLVVPEMLLLLFLVQGNPITITKWAFSGRAERILMVAQMFRNLFCLVFRESNIAELAS